MKIPVFLAILALPAFAGDCRVLVDGTGCRTRQLAVARIFENLPGVKEVEILPRADAPAQNQRYFLIRSTREAPGRGSLIEALGRRAKFYHIVSVTPEPAASAQPRKGQQGPSS